MNTSNKGVIQQLMESQRADNICHNLMLRPDSYNASPHEFFSFDMSVKENLDDLLFLFHCIAQNSAHLLAQVCEATMETHISLVEIFRQRHPQTSSHIFPKLEEVVIKAQKSQDIPLLTNLLRKYAKYITAPTWQNLLAFRIDKELLDVFMEQGALEHIGTELVKEYFIHACWGSSKLTFNICWDF
jgi:hypothetical protein